MFVGVSSSGEAASFFLDRFLFRFLEEADSKNGRGDVVVAVDATVEAAGTTDIETIQMEVMRRIT